MSARDGLGSAWRSIVGACALGASSVLALQAGAIGSDEPDLHRAAALAALGVALLLVLCLRAPAMRPRAARGMGCVLTAFGIGAGGVLLALDAYMPLALAPRLFTPAFLSAGGLSLETLCANGLPSVPYARKREHVLLAGFGRGVDFACAAQRGASAIDVAEPSAAVRARAASSVLPELAAAAHTQLSWHAASARALASNARYDLIVLPVNEAAHAWPAGLLPLAQDSLRTEQGLRALLALLAPKGELFAVVVGEPAALRLANTALLALRGAGIARPQLHVVVHQSGESYGISVRASAYDLDEMLDFHRNAHAQTTENPAPAVDALLNGAERFPELSYSPGSTFQNRVGELLGHASATLAGGGLERRYAFDISPLRDARPLPAQWDRRDRPDAWSSHSAYRLLPEYALLAALFALVLGAAGARVGLAAPKLGARTSLAFAALGMGQALAYACMQHALALWLARPLLAFGVIALAWFTGTGLGLGTGARVLGARARTPRPALGIAWLSFVIVALSIVRLLASANRIGAAATVCLAGLVFAALGFAFALPLAVAVSGTTPHDGPRAPRFLVPYALAIAVAVPLASTLVLYAGYTAVAFAAVGALTLALLTQWRAHAPAAVPDGTE